ncbi:MAG: TlyA family rRNA (cytidine-2'-O)-methyltransferase [Phycisphaerae bacterium]|nr:TlyA family rRNA (cytidine-2'-O)-methyltransferase [Phycisphaerae bacterium]
MATDGADREHPYVSRGGLKLEAALDAFGLSPTGWWCVDLGCSTGGFTDCLVQRGAERVFSVDTAYGELAWKLRNDERVTVMERSNALHTAPHADCVDRGGLDLAVIDLGWTPQARALPATTPWLGPAGAIISLIKPHYEKTSAEGGPRGAVVLDADDAERITLEVVDRLRSEGYAVDGLIESPVLGGKRKRRGGGQGNREWLALVRPPR